MSTMKEGGAMEKKPMYKVTHPDSGGDFCVFKDWGSLRDAELDCAEEGDKIIVELVFMTDKEFDDLGDFEGW
jgi:hypothetical protein